ncbi:MAG: Tol-Pal system beta propeller repeat protein TolB, partial [Gammaproteobacteria bacterium]|nr:Tol-Pal system beta propeller repeat protein TolB [Gammaproteobacteria bacterium]
MRVLSRVWILSLLLCGHAWAVLEIDITQGVQGLPIAVNPFAWQGDGEVPMDLAKIVDANLARSGQFSPLHREDMLSQPRSIFEVRFADWRALGMSYLLIGKLRFISDSKRYQVEFRLYDVQQSQQLEGRLFSNIKASQLRRVAHNISDLVYKKITGMQGAFNTLVCFISAEGSGKQRRFKLHVADSDGHGAKTILSSKEPLMSPAWSPDGRQLAYVSFEKAKAAVYVQQINSGERQQVSAFKGINGAPSWSPDGKKLALILSYNGNPDVYLLDLQSKKLQQLTGNSAIDTEPVWTPDGKSIIFTSDRSGGP